MSKCEKCLKRPYNALPSLKWFDSLIKVIEELWDNEKFYNDYVSKSYETGKRYSDINGSVEKIIYQLIGGLKSSMGYLGSKKIKDLRNKSNFVKITKAGFYESMVHNIDQVLK